MRSPATAAGRILSGHVMVTWVPRAQRQAVLNMPSRQTAARYFVTQIRHQLTEYDQALDELGHLPRSCEIYRDIRNRVLSAIAETYPEYAEAAQLQMLAEEAQPEISFSDDFNYDLANWFEASHVRNPETLALALTPTQRTALQMLTEGYSLVEIGSVVRLKLDKLHCLFQQIKQGARKTRQGELAL